LRSIALPGDRGEDEKGAADNPEKQTHDPELPLLRKRGDCCDGNRDLEHGYTARENFVFVDALEQKSGQVRRVRIPPTIVQIARIKRRAA